MDGHVFMLYVRACMCFACLHASWLLLTLSTGLPVSCALQVMGSVEPPLLRVLALVGDGSSAFPLSCLVLPAMVVAPRVGWLERYGFYLIAGWVAAYLLLTKLLHRWTWRPPPPAPALSAHAVSPLFAAATVDASDRERAEKFKPLQQVLELAVDEPLALARLEVVAQWLIAHRDLFLPVLRHLHAAEPLGVSVCEQVLWWICMPLQYLVCAGFIFLEYLNEAQQPSLDFAAKVGLPLILLLSLHALNVLCDDDPRAPRVPFLLWPFLPYGFLRGTLRHRHFVTVYASDREPRGCQRAWLLVALLLATAVGLVLLGIVTFVPCYGTLLLWFVVSRLGRTSDATLRQLDAELRVTLQANEVPGRHRVRLEYVTELVAAPARSVAFARAVWLAMAADGALLQQLKDAGRSVPAPVSLPCAYRSCFRTRVCVVCRR